MFEKALRMKLRFNFKGTISTEDLFDLSIEDLDTIFKELKKKQKTTVEESLLQTKSKEDDVLALQIAIVTHVFLEKVKEAEARETAVARKEKRQKLLNLLERKRDAELEGKTAEELEAMIDDL